MLLNDRVAIVTGGSKGMGRATCVLFAQEGAAVTIADIDMAEANETLRQVEAASAAPAFLFKPETAIRVRWDMNTDTPLPPD